MVGRINNEGSAPAATMNKDVQKTAPTQASQVKTEQQPSNEEKLPKDQAEKMVASMNKFLASANSQLKFQFHDKLNEYYVTIIDTDTEEVIREIPSKKLMDIHAAMREFVGLLVDRKI